MVKVVGARSNTCTFCGGTVTIYSVADGGKDISYYSVCESCNMACKGDIRHKEKVDRQDIENEKFLIKRRLAWQNTNQKRQL